MPRCRTIVFKASGVQKFSANQPSPFTCFPPLEELLLMTIAVMSQNSSIDRNNKRLQFTSFLDRALVLRHNQLMRARRQRIQSGQYSQFFKPR